MGLRGIQIKTRYRRIEPDDIVTDDNYPSLQSEFRGGVPVDYPVLGKWVWLNLPSHNESNLRCPFSFKVLEVVSREHVVTIGHLIEELVEHPYVTSHVRQGFLNVSLELVSELYDAEFRERIP